MIHLNSLSFGFLICNMRTITFQVPHQGEDERAVEDPLAW